MANNICYHTRLYSDNTKKVVGGSFSGQFDWQTVNSLVNNYFDVVIKPSGAGIFVDKDGREVSLYFSVDPLKTVKGIDARRMDNLRRSELATDQEVKERKVNELIANMSTDELLERLS